MIKHKDQRVGVFIDVQNMYYSAKNLYNSKVNFGNILETAVAGRELIRAIAYVVKATGDEQPFFDALFQRGLETKERPVQVFDSGAKKADWDVGIAVDAIRIGEILDVIVLVSGDGDFVELVEYLKHHGRQVEVIAFRETTSGKLVAAVDDFTDLSADKDRYLIKPPAPGAKKNPPRQPRGRGRAERRPRTAAAEERQPGGDLSL
ncbi:MAG TPA: NYN domain-containing protein [Candidatus Eisenbacteria bacterium]|nr:NYN domain-containing protein [Candidatus Eisenbacteria bacterium]